MRDRSLSVEERIDLIEENLGVLGDTIKEAVSLLRLLGKIRRVVTGEKKPRKTKSGKRKTSKRASGSAATSE